MKTSTATIVTIVVALLCFALGMWLGTIYQGNNDTATHDAEVGALNDKISKLETEVDKYKEEAARADELQEKMEQLFDEYEAMSSAFNSSKPSSNLSAKDKDTDNVSNTSNVTNSTENKADDVYSNTTVSSNKASLGVKIGSNGTSQGVKIVSVVKGGAADEAGLKAGQVIASVDGNIVKDPDALVSTLVDYNPGDTVTIGLANGSEVKVKLQATEK